MTALLRALAPYLVVAGLAFVAGGLTCRPGPPDPALAALRDSLAGTREDARRTGIARDSILAAEQARAGVEAARAGERAAAAAEASRRALRERVRGDSLAAEVRRARTGADSLPLLVARVDALLDERMGLEIARDRYREAAEDAIAAVGRLTAALDTARAEVRDARARVAALERLADGLRPAGPCRILGRLPCPVLAAGYGLPLSGEGAGQGALVLAVAVPLWPRR